MNKIIENHSTRRALVFLCGMLFFLGSLENFGEKRYPFMLLTLSLVFIVYTFKSKLLIDKKTTLSLVTLFLFSVLLGLLSQVEFLSYKSNIGYDSVSFIFATAFKLICAYFIISPLKKNRTDLLSVLNATLLIHVVLFYFQLLLVYVTGIYFDPMDILLGQAQRYNSNFSLPIVGSIYRPTGFYEEPSTYSAFIVCFLACKLLLGERPDKLVGLAVISIILSFSVASIAYGVAILLYLMFFYYRSSFKYLLYLALPIIFFCLLVVVESRINSIGSATDIRYGLLLSIFNQNYTEILFGNGILGVPTTLSEYLVSGTLWRAGVASLNDNGLWLFIILKFGVIGLVFLFSLMYRKVNTRLDKFFLMIVFVTKISLLNFTFVFYLLLIMSMSGYIYDNKARDKVPV